MKKKYITPTTELMHTQVQSMLALSLIEGQYADPDQDVLVKDDDEWGIWGDEE